MPLNSSKTGVCPVLMYDWSEFGRSANGEELTGESNEEMQFYASGFSKVTQHFTLITLIMQLESA